MAESAGEQSTGEPFRSISQRWSALSHFTTASVLFTQRINTSQSPCNSFFEFTCTAQSGEDVNDKYSTIGSNMMQLAEELLSTPPKDEVWFNQIYNTIRAEQGFSRAEKDLYQAE